MITQATTVNQCFKIKWGSEYRTSWYLKGRNEVDGCHFVFVCTGSVFK